LPRSLRSAKPDAPFREVSAAKQMALYLQTSCCTRVGKHTCSSIWHHAVQLLTIRYYSCVTVTLCTYTVVLYTKISRSICGYLTKPVSETVGKSALRVLHFQAARSRPPPTLFPATPQTRSRLQHSDSSALALSSHGSRPGATTAIPTEPRGNEWLESVARILRTGIFAMHAG
jgi:hypothetical protein